jgi:hypothetical protein
LSASSRKEKPVSNVENLSKKLDEIIQRLDLLEKMILENPEHRGAAAAVGLSRLSIGAYGEPLKLAERLKNAERYLRRKPIAQDEISRCVIQALARALGDMLRSAGKGGWGPHSGDEIGKHIEKRIHSKMREEEE